MEYAQNSFNPLFNKIEYEANSICKNEIKFENEYKQFPRKGTKKEKNGHEQKSCKCQRDEF
jgi:hypothetical protein